MSVVAGVYRFPFRFTPESDATWIVAVVYLTK